MKADYSQARKYVDLLYDEPDRLTFQTFCKKDPSVKARILHGSLDKCWDDLQELNSKGSGVYIMVNRGNCRGRTNECVTDITSAFVDLDGSPLTPLLVSPIKPHVILASSDGRYQGMWKLRATPVSQATRERSRHFYEQMQKGIARKFGGDPSVCALSQVARLPGFLNHNHEEPFLVEIVRVNKSLTLTPPEFFERHNIEWIEPFSRANAGNKDASVNLASIDPIYKGSRGTSLFKIARQLAYKGILDTDLLRMLSEINRTRCKPPVESHRLTGIAHSVSKYWHTNCVSTEEIVARIMARNPSLRLHKGNYYRYDSETRQHRVIELRSLRTEVFLQSKRTAGSDFIDHVLEELAKRAPTCLFIASPERNFISDCIVKNGKAVLHDIYKCYEVWCVENEVTPVTQACLRKEIQIVYPGTYRKDVRIGKKRHRGFLGLSMNSSTKNRGSIFYLHDSGNPSAPSNSSDYCTSYS